LTPLGPNAVILADAAGYGIQTFDLIHQRGRIKLADSASSNIPIWTNQVVTISHN